METRIKERLTGALILVALMVIVVPEFLSGHAPRSAADAVPAARPASEGPPLVTYKMSLDGTTDSMPGQAALNVQPTQSSDRLPAPAPKVIEPPQAAATAPQAAAPPVAAPPLEQVAEAPPPAPAVAPEKKPEDKKPADKKPADKKPPEKKVDAKPVAADKKGWFVQLGVFTKHENAEQMVKQAAKKGHPAQVSGSGTTWRVRVGPLADRAAALAVKKRLAADGLAGNVVAP